MQFDFLISSERSGSNLITKLISNNSYYCGPNPPHLLRTFSSKMESFGNLEIEGNWGEFIDEIIEFFKLKIAIWETDCSKEELKTVKPRTLSSVVKYIYQKEAHLNGKKHVFIKEVATEQIYSYIEHHFDGPRFIWLVRDPRDMALSWSKSPVHRGDIVRAAKVWKSNQQRASILYKTKKNIKLVKYEDLVSNQEEVLKEICLFLGVPFEPEMIDFHKNQVNSDNASQTDNWKNLKKKIISNNYKKYKKELSRDQIQFIERLCAKEMQFLNYSFDYDLIDEKEFERIEKELTSKERNEKEEYKLISDSEKEKRNKWQKKFTEIKSR